MVSAYTTIQCSFTTVQRLPVITTTKNLIQIVKGACGFPLEVYFQTGEREERSLLIHWALITLWTLNFNISAS